jgi:hypothetical protein
MTRAERENPNPLRVLSPTAGGDGVDPTEVRDFIDTPFRFRKSSARLEVWMGSALRILLRPAAYS